MANSPFPPQTFPDGFPTQPEEAVMAAYFLTPEEREEWLTWLPTTTEDKKQELVSTLHEIFVQNQKNVLPQGFTAPPMGNNNQGYNPQGNNGQNNFQNPPQNAGYNPSQNSGFQQQYQPQQQPPQNAGYNPQNQNPNFGQDFPVPAAPAQAPLPPSPNFAPDNNFGNYNFQDAPEPQNSPYSSSYEQELKEFNNQNPPAPAFNAPAPEARFEPANENSYAQNPYQAPAPAAVPIPVRSSQPQPQEEEEEEFSFEEPKNEAPYVNRSNNSANKEPSEESFLNLTKTQYTSSPILNKDQYENELVFADDEEEEEEEIPAPKAPERKAPAREVREDFPPAFAPENKAAGKLEVEEAAPKPKANANFSSFNGSKDLENVYNLYLESQQKSANLEKEYQRRQQEQAESQQAFLNKVLNMLSDFELMKEKELDKTRVMSDLSGKVQKLMNVTDVRGSSSLQSQINRLESKLNRAVSDVEVLSRDLQDFKSEVYEKISEISEKVAEKEGDVYGASGINQKLDLLTSKIARLESQNKLNSLSSSLNSSGE